jgi:transcriptional regulator with XRE-family HTH domain
MTARVNISTVPSAAGAGDRGVLAAVAAKVEALRRERRLSLDQLSARAGVSKGMLVQIERQATNPSIATLCRIAAALGVSVADLLEPPGAEQAPVIAPGHPKVLWRGPRGGSATLLVGSSGPDMLELWAWELRAGERYDAVAHPEGTQELLQVHSGRLAVLFGRVSHLVGQGRSARAWTDRPHSYACVGRRPVRFTMVVFEPHRLTMAPRR